MKRVEKIKNFYGVDLTRENGEKFSFGADEVKELSTRKIDGRHYSIISLVNGFEIAYRHTIQCTFYEIIENSEVACTVLETPENEISPSTFDINDISKFMVENFYDIKFKELLTFENELNIFFGLSDYEGNLYIPVGTSNNNEICIKLKENDLNEVKTESKLIDGHICSLDRKTRTFDFDKMNLKTLYKGDEYDLSKSNVDGILKLSFEGNYTIGFEVGETVIVPIVIKTKFFEVMRIEEFPLSEIAHKNYLYRKYKKKKSTRGVTDLDYTNMFSYLNF